MSLRASSASWTARRRRASPTAMSSASPANHDVSWFVRPHHDTMRILTITDELPPYILGGSGRIAWETSKGLQALGHEVTILTAATAGTFAPSIDGVQILTLE